MMLKTLVLPKRAPAHPPFAINYLEHALGGKENVVRLEVAVDDLRLVEVHQRVGQLS